VANISPKAVADPILSAWLKAERGFSPEIGARGLGWLYALVTAVSLPLASPYFLLITLVQYLRVLYVNVRNSAASYGSDAALGFDLVASVVIIPFAGLFASTGVSVAFYMLSEEDQPTWQSSGWTVLAGTIILTVELIWLTARTLSRHKSGVDVLIFEQDADPYRAIAKLRSLRSSRVPGYMPGRFKAADALAFGALETDIDTTKTPTLRQSLACMANSRLDRLQLILIAIGGVGWFIWPFFWRPETYRWWVMALFVLVSYALLILSQGLTVQSLYLDRLRWLKRSWVLWRREVLQQEPEVGSAITLTDLAGQVAELADKIEALQRFLSKGKKGSRRPWML
jgi:hypothetical protein